MPRLLGSVVGLIVRLWVSTLRVEVRWRRREGARHDGRPSPPSASAAVYAFYHGQQMLLLAARGTLCRRGVVLVSRSRDGEIQSSVMQRLGFDVVRGSSSRGAARGLLGLVRRLRQGHDALVAVDGPRGPAKIAKQGAGRAACLAAVPVIPVVAVGSSVWSLRRSWDRFGLPLPFSRVVVLVGSPVTPSCGVQGAAARRDADVTKQVARDLADLDDLARQLLASGSDPWQGALPEDVSCPRS